MSRAGFEDLAAARARVGRRPRVRDMAPLYRPGFLIIRLYRALSPANLLVGGATQIEARIERYLEAHRDSAAPRYPRCALQGLLRWLIEAPERASGGIAKRDFASKSLIGGQENRFRFKLDEASPLPDFSGTPILTRCDGMTVDREDSPRRRWPAWLPRIGILPDMSIGLGRDDAEFDGRVLVIQWGRFVFEIFLGSHA